MVARITFVGAMCMSVVAWAAVTVTPARVQEMRSKDLLSKDESGRVTGDGLTVTLKLDGPETQGATRWGKSKITQATDDTGKSLVPPKHFWVSSMERFLERSPAE
jgi:hypothetical protein